jgi:hypothetical protein
MTLAIRAEKHLAFCLKLTRDKKQMHPQWEAYSVALTSVYAIANSLNGTGTGPARLAGCSWHKNG